MQFRTETNQNFYLIPHKYSSRNIPQNLHTLLGSTGNLELRGKERVKNHLNWMRPYFFQLFANSYLKKTDLVYAKKVWW